MNLDLNWVAYLIYEANTVPDCPKSPHSRLECAAGRKEPNGTTQRVDLCCFTNSFFVSTRQGPIAPGPGLFNELFILSKPLATGCYLHRDWPFKIMIATKYALCEQLDMVRDPSSVLYLLCWGNHSKLCPDFGCYEPGSPMQVLVTGGTLQLHVPCCGSRTYCLRGCNWALKVTNSESYQNILEF